MPPQVRSLRRLALLCFVSWAAFVAAALRLAIVERTPESELRLGFALIATAIALFAVLRAGAWPKLLYVLAAGYFGYFVAASGWHELWRIAEVPADGPAETLALALELAVRAAAKQLRSGAAGLALAQGYELAVMPLVQLLLLVRFARTLLTRPPL